MSDRIGLIAFPIPEFTIPGLCMIGNVRTEVLQQRIRHPGIYPDAVLTQSFKEFAAIDHFGIRLLTGMTNR